MSPQERFRAAVLRGMKASPFAAGVIVLMAGARHHVSGAVVSSGDNKAKAEEFGLEHLRTLDAHLPKLRADGQPMLPRRPDAALDAVEYLGRNYKIESVEGEDAASPVWVIHATCPLK
jgi:hypothetical protein